MSSLGREQDLSDTLGYFIAENETRISEVISSQISYLLSEKGIKGLNNPSATVLGLLGSTNRVLAHDLNTVSVSISSMALSVTTEESSTSIVLERIVVQ